jgi:hypothetical protein
MHLFPPSLTPSSLSVSLSLSLSHSLHPLSLSVCLSLSRGKWGCGRQAITAGARAGRSDGPWAAYVDFLGAVQDRIQKGRGHGGAMPGTNIKRGHRRSAASPTIPPSLPVYLRVYLFFPIVFTGVRHDMHMHTYCHCTYGETSCVRSCTCKNMSSHAFLRDNHFTAGWQPVSKPLQHRGGVLCTSAVLALGSKWLDYNRRIAWIA